MATGKLKTLLLLPAERFRLTFKSA